MKRVRTSLLGIIVTATLCVGISSTAQAAAYKNKEMTLKQPDNTEVKVKVTGDEYYQHIESIDGYTLCRDDEGWIRYAKVNDNNSEYVATGAVYSGEKYQAPNILKRLFSSSEKLNKHEKIDKKYMDKAREKVKKELNADAIEETAQEYMSTSFQAKADYAATETINGITLLIDFPDKKSDVSKAEINNFFNQSGYKGYSNNGSVKDYFNDVSGGKVTYQNTITEFYTAKNPKSYYDSASENDYSKALELVNEVLTWAKSQNIDFSKLTLDSNGMVKGVNILYAGTADAGWAKGLWPHKGYIPTPFSIDGVKIQSYQMSNIGKQLSLATICHENGHLLFGYPDLYDYTGKTAGCGTYSLMSYISNEKNPVPPDPYCRNVISGWNSVVNLDSTNDGQKVSANSSENGTQQVYKWSGNKSKEYYLIENIKKSGRYSTMPDEGLAIWHVNENGAQNNTPQLSVVQADNKNHLENNANAGGDGDLFHAGYKDTFNDTSAPNSKWLDNTASGLDISNISSIGETMTFIKSGKGTTNGTTTDDKVTDDKTDNETDDKTDNETTDKDITEDTVVNNDGNIAAKATVTTSYCSPWETIKALNDGFIPVNSNDRNHDVYGNWPQKGTQWVQYKFDKKYKISKTDVYWFKDNQGIDVPTSYKIKYMDNGKWKYVSNGKGFGVAIDKFNTTTFDTITTDTIAIEMTAKQSNSTCAAQAKSTGILEWKVYGEANGGSVTDKDDTTTEKEEVTEDKDTTEKEEVTEDKDTIEKEEVTEDKDATENEEVTEDKDATENEEVTEDKDATENEEVTEDKDTTENEEVTEDKDTIENGNATEDEESTKSIIEKIQKKIKELEEQLNKLFKKFKL